MHEGFAACHDVADAKAGSGDRQWHNQSCFPKKEAARWNTSRGSLPKQLR
jgi:hypothetical protein